jgi:hypothetical protein
MTSENQNSNNWKIKLDELSSLPGETVVDKNAAWTKLDARLRRKRKEAKPIWYWVAAACILFAIMIPLLLLNKEDGQLTTVEIEQKPIETKKSEVTAVVKKDSIKKITSPSAQKNMVTVENKTHKISTIISAKKPINQFRVPITVSTQDMMAETKNISLQPINIPSGLAASPPVKKQLKVVHINELGDPVKEMPEMANREVLHSFQIKLAGQETYSDPPVALNKKGFTIFKIKTSSN